jgi:hypothetical protein
MVDTPTSRRILETVTIVEDLDGKAATHAPRNALDARVAGLGQVTDDERAVIIAVIVPSLRPMSALYRSLSPDLWKSTDATTSSDPSGP